MTPVNAIALCQPVNDDTAMTLTGPVDGTPLETLQKSNATPVNATAICQTVNDDQAMTLMAPVDGPPLETIPTSATTPVNAMELCQPVNDLALTLMSPVDATPLSEVDIQRKYWSENRQKRQEEFAVKAMKQRSTAVTNLGLGPGAVLTLKVDYYTHSHASRLIAMV